MCDVTLSGRFTHASNAPSCTGRSLKKNKVTPSVSPPLKRLTDCTVYAIEGDKRHHLSRHPMSRLIPQLYSAGVRYGLSHDNTCVEQDGAGTKCEYLVLHITDHATLKENPERPEV